MKGMKNEGDAVGVRCPSVPEFITCPTCGLEMELWSAEEETRCVFCGYRFFRRELTVH
jgi:primosomal protein N'